MSDARLLKMTFLWSALFAVGGLLFSLCAPDGGGAPRFEFEARE